MSGKKVDRRIGKTKSGLWQALLFLLQRQDWEEINVQTICDRANVARSSFYAHFDNKAALLDYGFSQTTGEIKLLVAESKPASGRLATLDWLVDHTKGNSDFVARAIKSVPGQMVFLRFRGAIADVLSAELESRKAAASHDDITFVVAGCFAVIQSHAERGTKFAEEDLKSLLHRLANRILLF